MDKIKGMVGDAGGLKDKLDGINFPVQKNQLVSQLQQKGVPSQVTDQLNKVDTDQFQSKDDVMSKVKGMM